MSARNSISSVGHDEAPFRTRAGLPDRIGSSQSFVAKSAKADQQARCIFAQPCRKSPARGEGFCSRRQGCRLGHFTAPVGSMDRGRPSWVSTVDTLPLSPSARACSFSATSVVGNRSAYGHRTGYFRGRSHHERARCRRGAERGFGHHGGRQWCRALFGPVFSCNLPVPALTDDQLDIVRRTGQRRCSERKPGAHQFPTLRSEKNLSSRART